MRGSQHSNINYGLHSITEKFEMRFDKISEIIIEISSSSSTVKILKFGTPQTIAIIVLKLVKFDVTLH